MLHFILEKTQMSVYFSVFLLVVFWSSFLGSERYGMKKIVSKTLWNMKIYFPQTGLKQKSILVQSFE